MNYDEYIDIVVNSSVEDWNVIGCGGMDGPSYKSKFEFYEVWNGIQVVLTEESHSAYAVYKKDIAISLAFGITIAEEFEENWVKESFHDFDPHASLRIVDLFFL